MLAIISSVLAHTNMMTLTVVLTSLPLNLQIHLERNDMVILNAVAYEYGLSFRSLGFCSLCFLCSGSAHLSLELFQGG